MHRLPRPLRSSVSPHTIHALTTDPDQVKVTVTTLSGTVVHFHVKRNNKITKLKVSFRRLLIN